MIVLASIGPPDRTPGIRPKLSLQRSLDASARASFPGFAAALLMVVSTAPFGLPHQAVLLPAIAAGSVYFWSLFRPGFMRAPLVFLLGLLLDLLGFLPLGVGALCLLLIHAGTARYRPGLRTQPFAVVWLAFSGIVACAAVIQWAVISLLLLRVSPPGLAAFQWTVAVGLYPALAAALARVDRWLADQRE